MFKEYYERLLHQLSLDFNCTPADLLAKDNIITVSKLNEDRRSYSPGKPFLQMVTTGVNTVIMADECLHEFLHGFIRDVEGHRLFEFDKLTKLNEELKQYGYKMAPTHHMFLPFRNVEAKDVCHVKWLYDSEISQFYGDPRFPNAIAFPEPCPVRPDRIIVTAVDGDIIMGIAGCSDDAPHWQQIGIDVLPEYRSRGIGSCLVTLLKNKIIENGDVPFYGTAAANIQSQNIALNSGFRHAWVETEAVKIEPEDFEAAFRRSVAERKTYNEKFTAPDAHILAVDDTPVNLTVFKSLLKRTKMNIDTAESGDECIALVSEKKYDMIFLDHMMPIKDGMETLREMKELVSSPNADTPVVCLTANALTGMREVYISAGFSDHLTKPIDPEQLENLIIKYLPDNMILPPDTADNDDVTAVIPDIIYSIDEIDAAAGLRHCGTPDVYMTTLRIFIDTAAANADEMERYLNCGDMHTLTVKIHALKSTSRVIGAKGLGALAETLEKAGNEGDAAALRVGTEKLLGDYRSLAVKLAPIVADGSEPEKPMISGDALNDAYAAILEFSEALDYDSAAYVIKSLDGYAIPEKESECVNKLRKATIGFDYELIPEILKGRS